MSPEETNKAISKIHKSLYELTMSWYEADGSLWLSVAKFNKFCDTVENFLTVAPKCVQRQQWRRPKPQNVPPACSQSHNSIQGIPNYPLNRCSCGD